MLGSRIHIPVYLTRSAVPYTPAPGCLSALQQLEGHGHVVTSAVTKEEAGCQLPVDKKQRRKAEEDAREEEEVSGRERWGQEQKAQACSS